MKRSLGMFEVSNCWDFEASHVSGVFFFAGGTSRWTEERLLSARTCSGIFQKLCKVPRGFAGDFLSLVVLLGADAGPMVNGRLLLQWVAYAFSVVGINRVSIAGHLSAA